MIPKDAKPCEMCSFPRIKGERFCPRHRTTNLKTWRKDHKVTGNFLASSQDRIDRQRYGDPSIDKI